jgi:hypothetical protein
MAPDRRQADSLADAETVDVLLDAVRDLKDSESDREKRMETTSAVVLAAVGAVVIALLTSAFRKDALSPDLLSPWDEAAAVLFVLALGFLLAAELLTLRVLLGRERSLQVAPAEIETWASDEVLHRDKVQFQGRMLMSLVHMMSADRTRLAAKARRLAGAYVCLMLGLVAFGGLGLITGLHEGGAL